MEVAVDVRTRRARLVQTEVCLNSSGLLRTLLIFIRQQEVLRLDGPLLLLPSDPRSQRVSRVTSRLITALEEQDNHVVHGAAWPPKSHETEHGCGLTEREAADGRGGMKYAPSGKTKSTFMPWRPETSNPLKVLESADWNLYVIDLVSSVMRLRRV